MTTPEQAQQAQPEGTPANLGAAVRVLHALGSKCVSAHEVVVPAHHSCSVRA